MHVSTSIFALFFGASTASGITCAAGLYMIVARGTDEKPGTGATGNLTQAISLQIPGSIVHALDYPASFTNPDYKVSEADGVAATKTALEAYVKACPSGKVAIFGYSQGAEVTGNALCGGADEKNFGSNNNTAQLNKLFGDTGLQSAQAIDSDLVLGHVISIVHFGDPAFALGRPYDFGTAYKGGVLKRQAVDIFDKYAPMWQSWCDADDFFCASGNSLAVHQSYIQRRGKEAAEFVVKQWERAHTANSTIPKTSLAFTQVSKGIIFYFALAIMLFTCYGL